MINDKSLSALKKAQWTSHFNYPLYEEYAFTCLPSTVTKLLTGKGEKTLSSDVIGGSWESFNCVILFIIDGFGWEFFERYRSQYPFLQRFETEGIASKISAQFPSTTAAHITSLHTDQEVSQTGIYEWFYYEPILDRMITPLMFSNAGEHENSTLLKEGISSAQIFPFETVYQRLKKNGVHSIVMQPESIAFSPYSEAMCKGAEVVPFTHFTEGLDFLVTLCKKPLDQPTYAIIYFGDIDAMGHRHGIDSPQFKQAVDLCWSTIENRLWQKIGKSKNQIALLFTADHGMAPVDPKTTVYLNRTIPDITKKLKKNQKGASLVPAGSCRDFFLHVEEEYLQEMQRELAEILKGKGDVVLTQELLDRGFFGKKPPSKRLKERIGNLVVLPYFNESVWWFEKHRFEQHFYAAHGGLTPSEIESIFLYAPLGSS